MKKGRIIRDGQKIMKNAPDSGQRNNKNNFFGSLSVLAERIRKGTFGEILDDWRWIFSYSRKYKKAIIFYTILGMTSSTLGLVSSVASKYVIDIITGYRTSELWLLILITLLSAGISLLFNNLVNRISLKLSIDINNDIQADVFDQIADASWMSLNQYSNGDLLNRFVSDVQTVSSNAISWLPTIIIAVYNFIATFAVIWHYSHVMSLISLISAPVMLLSSRFLIGKQRDYGKKTREMSSKVMNFEVETFSNFDTIKSFGIMSQFSQKLREWQQKLKEMTLAYNMFSIKTNIFMSVTGLCAQYAAFGYCLFLLWTRQITYGTMTLFLEQRGNLSNAFNNVVSVVPNFLNSSVSAHRIRELVQLPREKHSLEKTARTESFHIVMNHVSFSYKKGEPVITDSSFEANPGEIVAMVGPSGEGKTTMIRLILGLIRPDDGRVLLVSSEGHAFEAGADSRILFSYVPQGNTILSGTIADNLKLVKEDATEEEMIRALKTACAWDFIEKLPEGLYSSVGARGRGLSEGQAQRIAIARALLRDAPILLLDEATSALDVTTERKLLRNIVQNDPEKTCIVTTHRPTVLNLCQRIYRIMDSKVTELSEEESGKMAMDF